MHTWATPPTLADAGRDVTPQLELLVAEALAKQPEHRFASAAEMIEALDRAVISFEPPPVIPPISDSWTGRAVPQPRATEVKRPPAPRRRLLARPRWLTMPARPRWLTRRALMAAGGGFALILIGIVIPATRSSA